MTDTNSRGDASAGHGRPNLLVIDDVEANVLGVRMLLERCGLDVDVEATTPTLALLDGALGHADLVIHEGRRTLDAVRRAAPRTPVLVLLAADDSARGLGEHDRIDWARRPLLPDDLRARATRLLRASAATAAVGEGSVGAAGSVERVEDGPASCDRFRVADLGEDLDADPDAAGHRRRVRDLAGLLAGAIGLDDEHVDDIRAAAALHDVGDLALAGETFDHDARLRMHTVRGADMLGHADDPATRLARSVARHHHEHWDGTGGPDALAGEDIPLPARIVAVVDSFDRAAGDPTDERASLWRIRRGVAEITRLTGTALDPDLVERFRTSVIALTREGSEAGPDPAAVVAV